MKRWINILVICLVAYQSFGQHGKQVTDTAWKSVYRATAEKINALVHTKLDARFDFSNSHLNGKAWITLKPHFYSTDSLTLDAKGMELHKVAIVKGGSEIPLKYHYDGWEIKIKLDKSYKSTEPYTVYIEYTAKPDELEIEGSVAIKDAKGLYFINPKGEEKDKPTQVWTQGETEATSVWVPTIDRPNQKSTQEFSLTVPSKFVTLSNGILTSQKNNSDGTRTDVWKMELPNAPYLFFMGAGDFAVVKDSYKGKEVSYYVEKEYAPVARKIFGLTPEMMAFFSKVTGIEYPWSKYGQIVVRDYVSGAMENTTATLHQEGAQQDARQLIDGNIWEDVISHELFHQWFGDYVTSESWSNLTLNESFANYGEYLWREYKYGKDNSDAQNYTNIQNYLGSQSEQKDLVRFKYNDKEDMFDRVSYDKGARILHMLRHFVGDSAFFKALTLYLTTNKFKATEVHHLRLAMEEVSGKDLNWFFNQWYFGSGHPILDINYKYDETTKKVRIIVKQTQASGKIFTLPVAVDIYSNGKKERYNVWVRNKIDTFGFQVTNRPDLVNFDADKILLAEKKENKTVEEYAFQYKNAGKYLDRREALEFASTSQSDPRSLELIRLGLQDKYYGLREFSLEKLDMKNRNVRAGVEQLVYGLASKDEKATVRAKAIAHLVNYDKPEYKTLLMQAINDSSYSISGEALDALIMVDADAAIKEIPRLANIPSKGKLHAVLSESLFAIGDESVFELVIRYFNDMPFGPPKLELLQPFATYLQKVKNLDNLKKGVELIIEFRDAIPAESKPQTDMFINNIILKGLASKKTAAGLKDQADYINSRINEKKGF